MDYNTYANLALYGNDHWVTHVEDSWVKKKKRYFCQICHCEVDYYQEVCYECEILEGIEDDQ